MIVIGKAAMEYERAGLPDAGTATLLPAALSGRLLYVEDNARIAEMTELMLEDIGLDVTWVDCAEGALARLGGAIDRFDLVLTDVVMPGMNGRDLATRVVAMRPGIRVLFASGYTDDALFRHGVLDDGSCFISKPYAPGELRQKIREALS